MLSHDDNNDLKSYTTSFMFHGKSSIRLTVVAMTTIPVRNMREMAHLTKGERCFLSSEDVISVATLI